MIDNYYLREIVRTNDRLSSSKSFTTGIVPVRVRSQSIDSIQHITCRPMKQSLGRRFPYLPIKIPSLGTYTSASSTTTPCQPTNIRGEGSLLFRHTIYVFGNNMVSLCTPPIRRRFRRMNEKAPQSLRLVSIHCDPEYMNWQACLHYIHAAHTCRARSDFLFIKKRGYTSANDGPTFLNMLQIRRTLPAPIFPVSSATDDA